MKYLVCNSTSYKNTDYGLPITVHKSTDYRTSSGTHHRFIPPFPEEVDARVRYPIKSVTSPFLNSDFYETSNARTYIRHKAVKDPFSMVKCKLCTKVNYVKSFEDKMFKAPVPPINSIMSETKSQYTRRDVRPERRLVFPPDPNNICQISALGRDEQPPLRPDERGFLKHLDIYLTTSRADYVPYSEEKQYGIARKDIITYYDATGIPRGKGYGPRDSGIIEPLIIPHIKPEYSKPGKKQYVKNASQSVPNYAYKSEYRDCFENQTRWYMEAYKFGPAESLGDPLPNATPWQTLAAPAMYCTEYCHIGTGMPLNGVVESKTPPANIKHKVGPSCLKKCA